MAERPDTATAAGTPDAGAVGYSIVLPPQWHEIPLRSGTDEAIKKILDGAIAGLRRDLPRDRVAPYRMEIEVEFGSRRVDYVIPVPGQRDRWLIAAFSTLGTGDPNDQHAKLLAELFEAIMATFRWTGS